MQTPNVISLDGSRCCGCAACAASCAVDAIAMQSDEFGFIRPVWNEAACVSCGRCDSVCPALLQRDKSSSGEAYWAQVQDESLLNQSSSGGVFGVLARNVLSKGGVVYGAALSSDCKSVGHVRVSEPSELTAVLTSKYVQSVVAKDVYRSVRDEVRRGVPVLYSGTPCQVAGMKEYLGSLSERECCILVDVMCHGVPSPILWSRWVEYLDRSQSIEGVNFRNKDTGWASFSVAYHYGEEGDEGTKVCRVSHVDDWYMKAFLHNASLRESCFQCPAKSSSSSDITLGDYWGFNSNGLPIDVDRGISAVIVRTPKGASAFAEIDHLLVDGKAEIEDISANNPALEKSVAPYAMRDEFMDDVSAGVPMRELVQRWTFVPSFKDRVRRKLRNIFAMFFDRVAQ